jgi:N-acetylmuramoyl-L-alanine amidase
MAWFDCAVKRPISTNIGGRLSPNLGLILHHAVANGSLFSFFNSPAAQVSAHFWVSKTGVIEQYVDSDAVAWHAKQLNGTYCGVETEGCTTAPYAEPLTQEAINALARLYAEGNKRYGWPFECINTDGQRGFGYHRMAVNTACPCDVRVNARTEILSIAAGSPKPVPTKGMSHNMIASTGGQGYWTVTTDGAVYAFGDAKYSGAPNDPKVLQPGVTILGIAGYSNDGYWLYASDGSIFAYGAAQYKGRPDRA